MRTTVSISDPVLANAKRVAAQRGVTLSDVVQEALVAHVSASPVSSPKPFRLLTVKGRPIDPSIDLSRTSALLVADDEAQYRPRRKPKSRR